MGTRGVWSLDNVEIKKPQNDWVEIPNVWISSDNNIGYWIGGGPSPSSKSIVDKMNYSSNTTARIPGADISVPKNDTTCAGTSTEGFAFYGFNGANYFSSIEKIAYATDTRTTPGNLPNPERSSACAIGSPTKAYVTGGYYPGGPIDGTSTYVYSTGSAGTMPGVGSRFSMAGSGNTTHGYVGGGPNPNSLMFKFTYASDSEAQLPGAPLSTPGGRKKPLSAASSTGSYFTGGNPGPMTTTDKLTFATDACARIPSADALTGIAYMQGTGNSNSAYMLNYNAVTFQNLSYSTDTYSNLPSGANLPVNKGNSFGCVSGRGNNQPDATVSNTRWFDSATETGNKMYCIGGTSGNDHDTFNMTTETAASLSLPGMPSMSKGASAQNTTHSYIHAGSGKQTKVRKITWSTNTGTTLPGTTSRNAESKSGVGNETKGYFTQGGSSPGPCYSGSDRVTYASDTIERVPGADMVGGRPGKFGAQATGNQDTGYFMGGGGEWPGFPNYSDTNKLTYATDTNANCPAQMPTGMSMYAGSSASSSTAAYASNYRNPSFHSKVFKLVFATDTIDTVGNTTVQRNGPAMGGNSTTMYMGGGSNFPNGNRSDFDKLVYATDTFSNLPDANLQSARYYTTGSGQRGERIPIAEPPTATPTSSTTLSGPEGLKLEGYIGKGRQPGQPSGNNGRTDVTKFSYSTETWSSSVSGTMPVARKFPGATSNTTRGYWAGGTPGTNSQIDKFVWSTNTGSTLPASVVLSAARGYMTSAAGNQTQGYWAFGNGDTDACDKMTYSNETMFTLPSMPFGTSRGMGVSMQTHGYYGSGAPGGSRFAKITFANDTKTQYNGLRAHPSGSNMFRTAASSNTKVYVCSGESSSRATESIPWATDSVSQLPTTFMPADVTGIAGQGDNTNAYFTGGPGPGGGSMTQRVVYSSDTVSVLPGANFPGGDVNSYAAGGPGMNGIANAVPNVI